MPKNKVNLKYWTFLAMNLTHTYLAVYEFTWTQNSSMCIRFEAMGNGLGFWAYVLFSVADRDVYPTWIDFGACDMDASACVCSKTLCWSWEQANMHAQTSSLEDQNDAFVSVYARKPTELEVTQIFRDFQAALNHISEILHGLRHPLWWHLRNLSWILWALAGWALRELKSILMRRARS